MVSGDTNQENKKYVSMSIFKKYTPFLQKAIEKLEKKKKKNSNSSGLQMKLNVFLKYLQIIQNNQHVPENLAKRMESTLEDMRRRSMKADEKTKSGSQNQEPLTSAPEVTTNGTELNGDSSESKQESDNEINNISVQFSLEHLESAHKDKKDKDHFLRPSSNHSSELDEDEQEVIDTNDISLKILKSSLNQTNDHYGDMTMGDVSFEDSQYSDSTFPIVVHNIKVEPDIVMETGVDEMPNPMSMMDASQPKMPNSMNDMSVSEEHCPYECSFCGERYRTLSNHRQHTYRHFKDYFAYRCSYCNRGFMTMARLNAHMQSWHPYQEIKYEKIDSPDNPVIFVDVPTSRNSNASGATRIASVTEMFKCAFCDHVCIPNDMAPHFMRHHPSEVPQMKILKDQNLLKKILKLPVTREKRIAKMCTAARHIPQVSRPVTVEPARKIITLKSTAKKAYNFPFPSTSSMNSDINEFFSDIAEPCVSDKKLKIWDRSRSIYVPVEDLRKMINFKCTVRLNDIINNFL